MIIIFLILIGSIYDLRLPDKIQMIVFCSYSLDHNTIQKTQIYRRIEIDKYSNKIN
jgi:hypothetical protein